MNKNKEIADKIIKLELQVCQTNSPDDLNKINKEITELIQGLTLDDLIEIDELISSKIAQYKPQ